MRQGTGIDSRIGSFWSLGLRVAHLTLKFLSWRVITVQLLYLFSGPPKQEQLWHMRHRRLVRVDRDIFTSVEAQKSRVSKLRCSAKGLLVVWVGNLESWHLPWKGLSPYLGVITRISQHQPKPAINHPPQGTIISHYWWTWNLIETTRGKDEEGFSLVDSRPVPGKSTGRGRSSGMKGKGKSPVLRNCFRIMCLQRQRVPEPSKQYVLRCHESQGNAKYVTVVAAGWKFWNHWIIGILVFR